MKKGFIYMIIAAVVLFFGASQQISAQSKGVKTLSIDEFNTLVYNLDAEELKYLGKKPAIIDFYADWCGPCRAISPILEELATEYAGKIVIYKVNVDNARKVAEKFGIRSIPAVLYIPVKGESKMTLGSRSKEKFISEIETYLLKRAK
jgi:thioredoxin